MANSITESIPTEWAGMPGNVYIYIYIFVLPNHWFVGGQLDPPLEELQDPGPNQSMTLQKLLWALGRNSALGRQPTCKKLGSVPLITTKSLLFWQNAFSHHADPLGLW